MHILSTGGSYNDTNGAKKIYLEILRILAILFVIFNHTGVNGFLLFSKYPNTSGQFWLYLFTSTFVTCAVPVFFMISGALLLPKDEDLTTLWQKRILPVVIVLLVFSLWYYFDSISYNLMKVDLEVFFQKLYSTNLKKHLWFLYYYIAFLIGLPFLRCLVKNLDNKYFLYLLIMSTFMWVLPEFGYLIWDGKFNIHGSIRTSWMISNNFVSPLLGYYIDKKMNKDNLRRILPIMWSVSIALTILVCITTCHLRIVAGNMPRFFNNTQIINAFSLFATFKWFFAEKQLSLKIQNFICILGGDVFFIYLMHMLVMHSMPMTYLFKQLLSFGMNRFLFIWIFVFLIVAVCEILSRLMHLLTYCVLKQ